MSVKLDVRTVLLVAGMTLTAITWGARADEIPIVTGQQWTKSSEELKKAYLIGVANVAQIEIAYHGENPPPDSQSFLPRLVRGMRGQTLDSVREGLNKWYASNPDKLQKPVLETIWFEMVLPGLKTAR